MTDIDVARYAILDLGSEDYYHLADAAVYLPSIPLDQRRAVAREAIWQLIQEGFVELFYGRMHANDVKTVPPDQIRRVLDDPLAWDAEGGGDEGYCFANTPEGDALYQAGPKASS